MGGICGSDGGGGDGMNRDGVRGVLTAGHHKSKSWEGPATQTKPVPSAAAGSVLVG